MTAHKYFPSSSSSLPPSPPLSPPPSPPLSLPLSPHLNESLGCNVALLKVLSIGPHLPLPVSFHCQSCVLAIARHRPLKQLQHCLRGLRGRWLVAIPDANRSVRSVCPPLRLPGCTVSKEKKSWVVCGEGERERERELTCQLYTAQTLWPLRQPPHKPHLCSARPHGPAEY